MIWFMNRKSECLRFLRQKNRRTKVMTLNCTDDCSSELDNTLSHSMFAPVVPGVLLYFCMEEQKEVGVYDF